MDQFDLQISISEFKALPELLRKKMERYGYLNRRGQYILCWDFTRYLNHSCSPTTRSVSDALDVAICDINPGEQLTCDYGILNYKDMVCNCGSANCRKLIKAGDCESFYNIWDQQIAEAWAVAGLVSQPLLPLAKLNEGNDSLLKALSSGECVTIPSSRIYKFDGLVEQ